MKNKKQFTLIELIIVIVVIGILAAMALPKFNGIIRNAKLAVMINDKEVLEKALTMYHQKNDELPLLNEDEELIVSNEGISLSKIVLAEEVQNSDMETIYKSLKETLTYYSDSEDSLYRIDLPKIKDNLSKDIKYGHKKHDKDFYVYSTKTGSVYYYDYLVNGNGTIQHTEYDTLLKDNELIKKEKSYNLDSNGIVINNKPIVELTTNLENIKSDTIINWAYTFIDEDETPTKISFILNEVEYDSFDKIPTSLKDGEYVIKLKMQDSKGIWSDEVIKSFSIENNKPIVELTTNLEKITTATIIHWTYQFIDEDSNPTKISFILNNIEYDSFDNLPTQLDSGNYTIKLKMQDSKGLWSDQIVKSFIVESNVQKNILSLGATFTIKIGNDGELYSWGANSYGQLGLGNTTKQTTPQKITIPNNEKAISVATGWYHSMIITNKGNLYSWGYNGSGQLGIGNTINQSTPQKITIPNGEKPISMALGFSTSMIITDKGNLYSWGSNSNWQLGRGGVSSLPGLVTIPNGEKPISISVGYYHSMALTSNGNLYAWGGNTYGQLGTGDTLDRSTPTKISIPNGQIPMSISTGDYHSLLVTNTGNLYSWGGNTYGQLGIGGTTSKSNPTLVTIPNNEKTKSISSGREHAVLLTTTGKVYAWGSNRYGQIASSSANAITNPSLITSGGVISINAGQMNSVYTNSNNNIFGWGCNTSGELSYSTTTNIYAPQIIRLP